MAGYIGSKASVTQVDGYTKSEADDRYVNDTGDTVTFTSNEGDALLIEQADGTDVGSLRINNGSFIIKGKHSTNPVQLQTHDGNEDIEVDPDGFIKMETAGSERLRLDASGNLMIGGTTAGNAGTVSINVGDAGSTVGGLQLWSTTTGTSYVQFGDESGTAANHYRGFLAYAHNGDSLRFGTAGSERMRLTNDGLTFNGDTAAANALDDYEEGTFTATCDSSVTLHSSSDLCSYIKIGKFVTLQGNVRVNSDGGGGAMAINNIPFARASGSEGDKFSVGSLKISDVNCAGSGIGLNTRLHSSGKILFEQSIDNASAQSVNAGNNGYYGFTISYIAA